MVTAEQSEHPGLDRRKAHREIRDQQQQCDGVEDALGDAPEQFQRLAAGDRFSGPRDRHLRKKVGDHRRTVLEIGDELGHQFEGLDGLLHDRGDDGGGEARHDCEADQDDHRHSRSPSHAPPLEIRKHRAAYRARSRRRR